MIARLAANVEWMSKGSRGHGTVRLIGAGSVSLGKAGRRRALRRPVPVDAMQRRGRPLATRTARDLGSSGRTRASRPCASASKNARSRASAVCSVSTSAVACRERATSVAVRFSIAKRSVLARRAGRPRSSSSREIPVTRGRSAAVRERQADPARGPVERNEREPVHLELTADRSVSELDGRGQRLGVALRRHAMSAELQRLTATFG
jgi:hypothetical protein